MNICFSSSSSALWQDVSFLCCLSISDVTWMPNAAWRWSVGVQQCAAVVCGTGSPHAAGGSVASLLLPAVLRMNPP